MNKLIRIASGTIDILKEHKDGLTFAGSIVGTVATGVTGVRSGIRIERKANKIRTDNPNVTNKDIFKATWTELIPVVACGAGGITCNVVQFASMKHKIEAAGATITALSTQLDKIKATEKEVLGEEKASEIQEKVANDIVSGPIESPTGKYWFLEKFSGAEIYTTKEEISDAIGKVNRRLTYEDISINEFISYIKKTDLKYVWNECGDLNGWTMGSEIDKYYEAGMTSNNVPCYVINYRFNSMPKMLKKRCFD